MLKRIDFHIHTIGTKLDSGFDFHVKTLQDYVSQAKLNAIAITNHNCFDKKQFKEIQENINDVKVFPGVEVTVESGHVLVISQREYIDTFDAECKILNDKTARLNEEIDLKTFKEIFSNYKKYLIIPHDEKKPRMNEQAFGELSTEFRWGEVSSAKKFELGKKSNDGLTPLLFSDFRACLKKDRIHFPIRFTYVEIDEISVPSLKTALSDKNKVFLSESKNDSDFMIDQNGTAASQYLNVVIGDRSSGKSFLLDKIFSSYNNTNNHEKTNRDDKTIKYLRQFELSTKSNETDFNLSVKKEFNETRNGYLLPIKTLLSKVDKIDEESNELSVEKHIQSLIEYAKSQTLSDAYSKAKLFVPDSFLPIPNAEIEKIIESISVLLDSVLYKEEINKILKLELVRNLGLEFIKLKQKSCLDFQFKLKVDEITKEINKQLSEKSAIKPVADVNFYEVVRDHMLIKEFDLLINRIRNRGIINSEPFEQFTIETIVEPFLSITNLKDEIGKNATFTPNDFKEKYNSPFKYLKSLIKAYGAGHDTLHKSFFEIKNVVKDKNGKKLSGGGRAEFNLLREIHDSREYDILLLDEPESAFDNPFLKNSIAKKIKTISENTTVFLSTHNNTLGVLLKPNKVIYTEYKDDKYSVYGGKISDKHLVTWDGRNIKNYDVQMKNMEAGEPAYEERRIIYENIKDQ